MLIPFVGVQIVKALNASHVEIVETVLMDDPSSTPSPF